MIADRLCTFSVMCGTINRLNHCLQLRGSGRANRGALVLVKVQWTVRRSWSWRLCSRPRPTSSMRRTTTSCTTVQARQAGRRCHAGGAQDQQRRYRHETVQRVRRVDARHRQALARQVGHVGNNFVINVKCVGLGNIYLSCVALNCINSHLFN